MIFFYYNSTVGQFGAVGNKALLSSSGPDSIEKDAQSARRPAYVRSLAEDQPTLRYPSHKS